MKKNKGFTLIELLVVIAIIGVLAGVILALTSSSRNRGNDARTLSQMKSMTTQADLYVGTRPSVSLGQCNPTGATLFGTANTGLGNLMKNLDTTNSRCVDTGTAWAVAFPLKAGGAFCVDSTGVARLKSKATSVTYTGVSTGATPALTGIACN